MRSTSSRALVRSIQSDPRRVALAILVAILLLYNPFVNATAGGMGLALAHNPSYRATIGASELQGFAPVDGQNTCPIDLNAAPLLQFVAVIVFFPAFDTSPLVVLPQPLFSSGLWFRPPPAA